MLELLSLVDFDYYTEEPPHGALPYGHPFTITTDAYHWTSTIAADNFGSGAWTVHMGVCGGAGSKDGQAAGRNLVWCVRDLE